MELDNTFKCRIAKMIYQKACKKKEELLSEANAEAMRISSENMIKANARRKEIEASCLEKVKALLEQTKKSADAKGRDLLENMENKMVDSVFLHVGETLSADAKGQSDDIIRELFEQEKVHVKDLLFPSKEVQE